MPRSMRDGYIRYRCKRNCWTSFIVLLIVVIIAEFAAYIFDIRPSLDKIAVPFSFELLSISGVLVIGIWIGARWQLNKCRNPEVADIKNEGWDSGWTREDLIEFGIPMLVCLVMLTIGGGLLKAVCTGCPLN